jgi:hypothetical protein
LPIIDRYESSGKAFSVIVRKLPPAATVNTCLATASSSGRLNHRNHVEAAHSHEEILVDAALLLRQCEAGTKALRRVLDVAYTLTGFDGKANTRPLTGESLEQGLLLQGRATVMII